MEISWNGDPFKCSSLPGRHLGPWQRRHFHPVPRADVLGSFLALLQVLCRGTAIRIAAYLVSVLEAEVPGPQFATYLEHWRRALPGERVYRSGRPPDSWIDRSRYVFALTGARYLVSAVCLFQIMDSKNLWCDAILALVAILLLAVTHARLDRLLRRQTHDEYCEKFGAIGSGMNEGLGELLPAAHPEGLTGAPSASAEV